MSPETPFPLCQWEIASESPAEGMSTGAPEE